MSAAFPNIDVVKVSLHRDPYAAGWLREEELYRARPIFRPDSVARLSYSGVLLAVRVGVQVWLHPLRGDDWDEVERLLREHRA